MSLKNTIDDLKSISTKLEKAQFPFTETVKKLDKLEHDRHKEMMDCLNDQTSHIVSSKGFLKNLDQSTNNLVAKVNSIESKSTNFAGNVVYPRSQVELNLSEYGDDIASLRAPSVAPSLRAGMEPISDDESTSENIAQLNQLVRNVHDSGFRTPSGNRSMPSIDLTGPTRRSSRPSQPPARYQNKKKIIDYEKNGSKN